MTNTKLDDWALEGIKTPQVLQSYILDKFSEASEGKFVVTDPNNVAAFLIEAFATMGSNILRRVDDSVQPAIYPSRAISTSDLYKHLSDYDYVGIFSYPAQATIMMIFDVSYLMTNGVPVDSGTSSSVRQLIIPETTQFTVGQYRFGLYYPIKLRVSPNTRMFVAEYDTTKTNPLKVLSTNTLEYELHKSNGLTYAFVKIPVYQFSTDTTIEPLVNGSGYRRVIDYTDKFYAIKCTAETYVEGEGWATRELALSMSGRVYDPDVPTAVFTVDADNNQCIVEIPYVYFTKGIIRGNLRVDIYTTRGYLNYTVPADTSDFVTIDMFATTLDSDIAKFVEPFRTMPGLEAHPYTEQITGGSDGYSYEELRRRIVNDSFGMSVLQTPKDVETYFANEGYVVSLYKDGITDRVYNAHATLRWTDNSIVACASIDTLITNDTLNNSDTVIHVLEDTYTILPSTRYKLDVDSGLCVPLTNTERQELNNLDFSEKVKAFNASEYTICPFHIQVSTAAKYPTTAVFDLTDADIDSNVFLTSRENVDKSLSVSSAIMEVVPTDYIGNKDMVTDKYRMTINVIRSGLDNITAVMLDEGVEGVKQFRVLVGVKKLDGSFAFAEAEYVNRTNNVDKFVIDISATAAFTQVGDEYAVRLKSPFASNTDGVDVFLNSEVRIVLLLRKLLFSDNVVITQDYLSVDYTNSGLEDLTMFSAVSENRLVVHFGKLVNELDARMSLSYSEEKYKEYETTQFKVLENDVYETDENGVPIVSWTNDSPPKPTLTVKYKAGTLESYAHTLEKENVVVSAVFASVLKGREIAEAEIEVAADSKVMYAANWFLGSPKYSDLMEGKWASVLKMPVIPKFSVTAATMSSSGENQCIGTYMMPKVTANDGTPVVGSSSDKSNVWYKVEDLGENGISYYKIEIKDALELVLSHIVNVPENSTELPPYVVDGVDTYRFFNENDKSFALPLIDGTDPLSGKYKSNPIAEVTPREGMFVLVINDNPAVATSNEWKDEYNNAVHLSRTQETAATFLTSGNSSIFSTLYLYKNSEWHLCAVFNDSTSPTISISGDRTDESEIMKARCAWAEHRYKNIINMINDRIASSSEPSFGFAYWLHRVDITLPTSMGDDATENNTEYSWSSNETPFEYVSFMNTDSDGIPVFDELRHANEYIQVDPEEISKPENANVEYYTKVDNSDVYVAIESRVPQADTAYYKNAYMSAWAIHANKWPWEVVSWLRLNRIDVSDDPSTPKYVYAYIPDTLFTTEMDKYRLTSHCKYVAGQYRLDSNGKPYMDKPRQLQYLLNMLQIDAKLAETSIVKSNHSYPRNLVSLMRTHFANLGNVKNRLYTNTKLFFEPMKSIGYGQFYTDGDTTTEYPLDITMGFKLHVSAEIANDETMLDNLRRSVISIIDDHMAEGGCSMTTIAELIKQNNSDSVRYVDVLGINGNQKLQTMRCVDPEVRPHLKHTLELEDDGITITLQRGLTLEFVVANE